jgi:hypothetical protein
LIGALFAAGGWWFGGLQLGASIGFGSALMVLNVFALGWMWQRVLDKKSVAWTILIIVIKYAVILGSIWYWAHAEWFSPLGAGLGIASFMIASLVLAAIFHEKQV